MRYFPRSNSLNDHRLTKCLGWQLNPHIPHLINNCVPCNLVLLLLLLRANIYWDTVVNKVVSVCVLSKYRRGGKGGAPVSWCEIFRAGDRPRRWRTWVWIGRCGVA